MLSDRVLPSSAEARVEGKVGGNVGVFELSQSARARAHTEPMPAVLRLMLSHGWSIRSPTTNTPQGERDFGVWSKISQSTKDEGRKNVVVYGVPAMYGRQPS